MTTMRIIFEALAFFSAIGRPVTVYEIWQAVPPEERPDDLEHLFEILAFLEGTEKIKREGEVFAAVGLGDKLAEKAEATRIKQDSFLTEKWSEVLRYRPLFGAVPFLDFACVFGSLAFGNVKENSDFDVLLGCRSGRIFTARFFTMLFFGILGKRRTSADLGFKAKNKFCFNHFLTPRSYKLTPPYTICWRYAYRLMTPIYGKEEAVLKFFGNNRWAGRGATVFDARFLPRGFNFGRAVLEFLLSSPLGSIFEFIVKKVQMRRILRKNTENKNEGERIRANSEELEFHPKEPYFREIAKTIEKFVDKAMLVEHPFSLRNSALRAKTERIRTRVYPTATSLPSPK